MPATGRTRGTVNATCIAREPRGSVEERGPTTGQAEEELGSAGRSPPRRSPGSRNRPWDRQTWRSTRRQARSRPTRAGRRTPRDKPFSLPTGRRRLTFLTQISDQQRSRGATEGYSATWPNYWAVRLGLCSWASRRPPPREFVGRSSRPAMIDPSSARATFSPSTAPNMFSIGRSAGRRLGRGDQAVEAPAVVPGLAGLAEGLGPLGPGFGEARRGPARRVRRSTAATRALARSAR